MHTDHSTSNDNVRLHPRVAPVGGFESRAPTPNPDPMAIPPMPEFNSGDKLYRRVWIAVGLLVLAIPAFFILGDGAHEARITDFYFRADGAASITIRFEKPRSDESHDVSLRFSGRGMSEDRTYDWAYIADHDDCSQTTPERPPPIGIKCTLRLRLPLNYSTNSPIGGTAVSADLEWAGRHQDSDSASAAGLYR